MTDPIRYELASAQRMTDPMRYELPSAESLATGQQDGNRRFTPPSTPHMPIIADFRETLREMREDLDEVKRRLSGSDDDAPEEPLYGNDGVKRSPGF
jgi:hypothetical protein